IKLWMSPSFSAYVNDSPVDFLPLTFKQGESIEVKLSNAS
ncbi:hypothetical protein AAUPMG_02763, partial [Pasteurella multocida subsp. multocida str. Anand1_goat]